MPLTAGPAPATARRRDPTPTPTPSPRATPPEPGPAPPGQPADAVGLADAQARLQRRLDRLATRVAGCDHASTSATVLGAPRMAAATDPVSARADRLQRDLGEGPGLQVLRTGHSVLGHDLRSEARWQRWCDLVVGELGLAAVLAVPLTAGTRPVGVLTLCSERPRGLSDVDFGLVHRLVRPLAAALGELRRSGDDRPAA